MNELVPMERIENRIFVIRGQKVMVDRDLAELYGVKTKELNKAVSRNSFRFPPDFMFQLSKVEYTALRFQIGTLEKGKHSKYLPNVFTEQGVAMLSSVLRSKRAARINILIMRAFVRLRKALSTNAELVQAVEEVRHKVGQHDTEIGLIIKTIEKMIAFEEKPKKRIGFVVGGA